MDFKCSKAKSLPGVPGLGLEKRCTCTDDMLGKEHALQHVLCSLYMYFVINVVVIISF